LIIISKEFSTKRFDNENMGVVHSESLLKRLGLNEYLPAQSPRIDHKPEVPLPHILASLSIIGNS
jgi:hypothetical protein